MSAHKVIQYTTAAAHIKPKILLECTECVVVILVWP